MKYILTLAFRITTAYARPAALGTTAMTQSRDNWTPMAKSMLTEEEFIKYLDKQQKEKNIRPSIRSRFQSWTKSAGKGPEPESINLEKSGLRKKLYMFGNAKKQVNDASAEAVPRLVEPGFVAFSPDYSREDDSLTSRKSRLFKKLRMLRKHKELEDQRSVPLSNERQVFSVSVGDLKPVSIRSVPVASVDDYESDCLPSVISKLKSVSHPDDDDDDDDDDVEKIWHNAWTGYEETEALKGYN